ncbi:MAG: hypothetical protein ACXVLT_11500 [Flavisolibacter sp.]
MEQLIEDGEQDLASFNSEELKLSYQKINTNLARNLLNGASLQEQENNIRMLNKISGELNRRKAFSGEMHDTEE